MKKLILIASIFIGLTLVSQAQVPDGYYKIISKTSGNALYVSNASNLDGANVRQWKWNNSQAQIWEIKQVPGGQSFTSMNSGKVLDVSMGSSANGANVQQYYSNGTKAQKWSINRQSDGTYIIMNMGSFKNLTALEGDRGNVVQFEYANVDSKYWFIQPVQYTKTNIEKGTNYRGGVFCGTNRINGKKVISTAYDISSLATWDEAKKLCNDLVLNGYSDWKLPDSNDLQAIFNTFPWISNEHPPECNRLSEREYWASDMNGVKYWYAIVYGTSPNYNTNSGYIDGNNRCHVRAIRYVNE